MKHNFSVIIIAVVAFVFVMSHLQSCDTDPCKDVFCVSPNGVCFDGHCVCLEDTLPSGEIMYWGGDSCQINLCPLPDSVACYNGGVCVWGICECPSGYVGDTCELELRGVYMDSYNVSDDCKRDSIVATHLYTSTITGAADSLLFIEIDNVYNNFDHIFPGVYNSSDTKIRAQVTESGLLVAAQSFPASGLSDYSVEGFSTVHDSTKFTLNYYVSRMDTSGMIIDTCAATYTVQ